MNGIIAGAKRLQESNLFGAAEQFSPSCDIEIEFPVCITVTGSRPSS
jgi:hypothetical protein